MCPAFKPPSLSTQETEARLIKVAGNLGLHHAGWHNLGPTWLGTPATIIAMANMTIPVLYHIIKREFEQLPGGGLVQKWYQGMSEECHTVVHIGLSLMSVMEVFLSITCTELLRNIFVIAGEGFPLWSAGMAAMYATEIVANHFMVDFTSTLMMDMHADSSLSTQEVGIYFHENRIIPSVFISRAIVHQRNLPKAQDFPFICSGLAHPLPTWRWRFLEILLF